MNIIFTFINHVDDKWMMINLAELEFSLSCFLILNVTSSKEKANSLLPRS